jgi:isoquinoline 1-oxidoreductase alpha subunit
MAIVLTVNKLTHILDLPGEMPLLWVLRDELHLKGTKFGCGIAQCGACTVHIDGQPARACITPLAEAAGKHITTIEALHTLPQGAAIQAAWETHDVPQCGYCQAGQMMTAAHLILETPHPSDADIDSAMAGNFCRCGTYLRIRVAIHTAAAPHATIGEGE